MYVCLSAGNDEGDLLHLRLPGTHGVASSSNGRGDGLLAMWTSQSLVGDRGGPELGAGRLRGGGQRAGPTWTRHHAGQELRDAISGRPASERRHAAGTRIRPRDGRTSLGLDVPDDLPSRWWSRLTVTVFLKSRNSRATWLSSRMATDATTARSGSSPMAVENRRKSSHAGTVEAQEPGDDPWFLRTGVAGTSSWPACRPSWSRRTRAVADPCATGCGLCRVDTPSWHARLVPTHSDTSVSEWYHAPHGAHTSHR